MNDLPRHPAADIGAVEDRFFTLRNFPLAVGTVMPEATIAYETYGWPAPDGEREIAQGEESILDGADIGGGTQRHVVHHFPPQGCRRPLCHDGIGRSRVARAAPSCTAALALTRHPLFGPPVSR